jgi:protease I
MARELQGMHIAIVATNGFEQSELTEPLKALKEAGAKVDVVAPKGGEIQGMKHDQKGDKVKVDRTLDEVRPSEYDGLVLPGGVANPDSLRLDRRAVAFIGEFFAAEKPVAAICHGPWTVIEAGAARGRTMTSWP